MAFDVQGFQQPNYQVNPVAGNKYAPQDGMTQLSNLLDYQTKNLALQKQQALQQAEIEKGLAESQSAQSQAKTAATQAQSSEFKLKGDKFASALDVIGARATDPRIIELSRLATQGGPEGLKAQDELHRLNGQDFKTLKQKGLTDEEALYQLGHISSLIHQKPNELPSTYENIVRQSASAANKLALQTPGLTTNAAGEIVAANPVTKKITTLGTTPTANINPTSADVANFNDYQQSLTKRVLASNNYLQRSDELKQLMSEFKPGAGTQTYANIAGKLQAIGAPQSLVDSVAKGDLGAVQSFNKFLAQSVIAGVQQAAGGNPTRVAEVENYLKNNPTVNTDPRALQRFIDFTDKLASRDIFENDTLAAAKKTGQFNPATWISDYQKFATSQGVLPKAVNPEGNVSNERKEKPSTKEKGNAVYGKYKGHEVVSYDGGKSWEYK